MKTKPWTTRPISPTCELIEGVANVFLSKDDMRRYRQCGHATSYAYPADGGGWCALCFRHGQKHLPHIQTIEELIRAGETFE